ncbi:hypothetical protein [Bacillus sp. T33-2]|uniref:hypothetical protein n=1 Tax=Bacillus sp. T33-2 TaxID=2054168 RepID=UPI000C777CF7|nr:hypothetical protein [Bacillus sp. T33-2]PLR93204.1 hypothetical protein CVD19_19565 [Bacillus sp. T33-2]
MFKFEIVVVPPGGGEAEFVAEVTGNRAPQPNEYVQLREEDGVSFFLVRNIITILQDDDSPVKNFKETGIAVEVEPVDYELQSPSQSRMIDRFKSKGLPVKEYVPSGY